MTPRCLSFNSLLSVSSFLKVENIIESLNQSLNRLSRVPPYCKTKQSKVYYSCDIYFFVFK